MFKRLIRYALDSYKESKAATDINDAKVKTQQEEIILHHNSVKKHIEEINKSFDVIRYKSQ